jgi:hypothetical protein
MLGFPSMNSTQNSQSNLKNLLEEGIISDEEYKSQLRKMNGFFSKEEIAEVEKASQSPSETFSGSELKAARKSHKGDYAVTKQHSALASQYIDAAKEILKKEPVMMSEKDLQTVEKIFAQVNKNPMLAEAFVKEANETTLTGKTTTLLGRYEQALTKTHGQKAAKEIVSEIKENLKQNIEGRNPELFAKFEEKSDKDSKNVEYGFADRVMNNPVKYGPAAVVAGTGAAYLGVRYGIPAIASKGGLIGLGVAAVGLAALALFKAEEK